MAITITMTMDAKTVACLKAMAEAEHDGNISMTMRLLIRKAGAERGLWPVPEKTEGKP